MGAPLERNLKIGIISRCDYTGLAIQSKEFFDHIPCKALVVDISRVNPNSKQNLHWYAGQPSILFARGQRFPLQTVIDFLRQINVLVCFETAYDYTLISLCKSMNIKTIIQPNYEFLEYGDGYKNTEPDLFIAPSMWHYDDIPGNKMFLPVPVNTKKFSPQVKEKTFIHVAGKPAVHDRNGTMTFLNSLRYVKNEITAILRSLQPIPNIPEDIPSNVTLIKEFGAKENYEDNYTGGVLVMPRKFGGNCLPVNESLACEMPVIMPNISPNYFWLPKEWLVPARKTVTFKCKQMVDVFETDQIALARKIDEFCNENFYHSAIETARNLKNQISWEVLLPKYMDAINGL